MLGYRDYVNDDVTQAYAGSGVLHVLSVSGLHVAVLYFVLSMMLGWMDRNRRLEIAKGIFIIMIMFVYAGLTGLSPPVLRSVWMFTLITIARVMDRDVSMYNVLGVSCLLLLLWDPYYIADVGFQLSYIAVAGIVYLYPLLSGLISDTDIAKTKIRWVDVPLNWLTRWTWGLICVSIAAQIATFPIDVFYFHTFPNYFLPANLLAIPLSNFVLIAGMALFAVSWSEWLSAQVGWLFDHLLIVLNKVVFMIDGLPFAYDRKGVMLTAFETVMLYIVIMMICWYIADRRARVLIATLCLMLVLCSAFAIHDMRRERKRELVVYHISGKKAIAVIDRGAADYDFDRR
jgi:competence protein ComEC